MNQYCNVKIMMYRIKLEDYKILKVCEKCYKNGEVIPTCNQCGGKGVHNKTLQKWVVFKYPEEIERIDRDSNGNLRYWDDASCFYEEQNKIVHFTFKDAQKECDKRNKELGV